MQSRFNLAQMLENTDGRLVLALKTLLLLLPFAVKMYSIFAEKVSHRCPGERRSISRRTSSPYKTSLRK